ncbi:MAG: butyrate kinase [Synergistaceae bacterium]|nr:butyrate kinase [Synergistaceae bacterium]
MKILAVSPAQECTKVALYENYDPLWIEIQTYDPSFLGTFPNIMSQEEFRVAKLKELLDAKGERLNGIQGFVATGGLLHPIEGGTYLINMSMLQDLLSCKYGESPANLGAPLAMRMAAMAGSRYAYVVDPPVVDEMGEFAHVTGLPEISRWSVFHALNMKAVAQREAINLGKKITDCNFIVCHAVETVSIGAIAGGKVIESNDVNNASGPMSLCQSGDLPPAALIDLCFSGKYTREELKSRVLRSAGLFAHFGTEDLGEILRQVASGERKPKLLFEAFLHGIVKYIGACAAALQGNVDAIILTGGMAAIENFSLELSRRISWIAPVVAYPGEDETLALVEGAIRALRGVEEPKIYA